MEGLAFSGSEGMRAVWPCGGPGMGKKRISIPAGGHGAGREPP